MVAFRFRWFGLCHCERSVAISLAQQQFWPLECIAVKLNHLNRNATKGLSEAGAGGVGYVNMRGLDAQTDLRTADREVLIEISIRQQAIIESLEQRIVQLAGRAIRRRRTGRMPGLKPKGDRKPAQSRKPRKPRLQGFARTRMAPTTREVIDLPPVPVEVAEHAVIGQKSCIRAGPRCRRRCIPPAQLDGVVMGKQRLGINLISLTTVPSNAAGPIHLLRDIHDLRALYPDDEPLGRWADAAHEVYAKAKAFTHPSEWPRRRGQLALEQRLLALCRPYRDDPSAVQAKLCRRVEKHIKSLPRTGYGELFVFVAETAVPPDNNAAERSRRHLVVSRKVSGGTRSPQGTETKMTLASVFGAWRAQGLNPRSACRQLLISPQV